MIEPEPQLTEQEKAMFKKFLAWLLARLSKPEPPPQPTPVPTPTPTPTPVPVPTPTPTPTPEPTPVPTPPPTPPPPTSRCPKPTGIKLGFRPNPTKLARGWRNEADITPLVGDGIPADPGCGEEYLQLYGEPLAFQTLHTANGWANEPVERASGSSFGCILRIVTNQESEWDGGRYKYAGPMTVGVSYPWLNYWRCQDVTMGADGRITPRGDGTNANSYNRPK